MRLLGYEIKKESQASFCRAGVGFYLEEMIFVGTLGGHREVGSVRRPFPLDALELGKLVEKALASYNPIAPPYSKSDNKSVWPSYQASGLKTMNAFERGLIDVDVNATIQEIVLSGTFRNNQDIAATMRLPRVTGPAELGLALHRVRKAMLAMRAANVV
ncbi:hypothetical protein [Rhodoferax sp.]|uniref:hypothetical protein n=1 Tax=Rhodoferax sp. TaxID=50421 RepID=UPI00262BBE17|nr:hypothetical protein [Rhodoferax sp.]MDD2926558.1 hypothetical protein [Rhodoferax sp.]